MRLHLEHLWQNVDDPEEVIFLFRIDNPTLAKKFIERVHKEALKQNHTVNLPLMLLVSIFPQKNPVARGDSQNIIIAVTEKVVPNAHLNGKLIYPGGNYEKDFSGSTDADGKFEYSSTIGKNGDIRPLSIEVVASSPAYESVSVTDSFFIVDSSGLSAINSECIDVGPTVVPLSKLLNLLMLMVNS